MPDNFPVRIEFKNETGFAHSFKDLAAKAFGAEKGFTLEYRQHEGYKKQEPFVVSLKDPANKFTKEFLALDERVRKAVTANTEMQALLKKASWDRADRTLWEGLKSDVIVKEMNKSELFKFANYNADGTPVRDLNQMGAASGQEYDCEAMAIIKGLMSERVERTNLTAGIAGVGYKKAYDEYYFVNDQVSFEDGEVSGHAAIFCPALRNVSDQKFLQLNASENYTFEDFKNSRTIFSASQFKDGSIHCAGDNAGMESYYMTINTPECAKVGEKEFLSEDQKAVADESDAFFDKYNDTYLTAIFNARSAFTASITKVFESDGIVSAADIVTMQTDMAAHFKVNPIAEQFRTNFGLGMFVAENNPTGKDAVTFGGETTMFSEFAPEVKPHQVFRIGAN